MPNPRIASAGRQARQDCEKSQFMESKNFSALHVGANEFSDIQQSNTDRLVEHLELLRAEQIRANDQMQLLVQRLLQVPVLAAADLPKLLQPEGSVAASAPKKARQKSPLPLVVQISQKTKDVQTDEGFQKNEHAQADEGGSKQNVTTLETCAPKLRRKSVSAMDLQPLEITKHHMLSWGVGYSGKKKLLQYNFNQLQAFGALPAAFAECSIFRLRRTLTFQVLLQPFLILAVFGLLRATSWESPEDARVMLQPVIHVPSELRQLVAFLLGLFISLQLKRWWSIRSVFLQGYFFSTAQLSLFLGCVMPNQSEELRQRMERYFLTAHRIIYLCARGETHLLRRLEGDGLLTADEISHLKTRIAALPGGAQKPVGGADMDLAEVPLMWIAQLIFRLYACSNAKQMDIKLAIPPPLMLKMVALCMDARRSIQDIEMMLTSPVPFSYVHIVCLLVQFYVMFACVASGIQLGTDTEAPSAAAVVTEIIMISAQNALYLALLCLTTVLDNPFTDEVIDFPAMHLQSRLWKSQIFARALLYDEDVVDAEIAKFCARKDRHKKEEEEEEDDDNMMNDEDGDE
eukprot:TRINITY_DN75527_c0_g1_i1.p1 TRINITY_DN75527_c0_g1~~TRINITY_DN75527_c0_g1_i1.p1  ORF type:complete len:574 (-),score=93.11 TRINITY_DN75527_c0_g1_i1:513-2234(-)